MNDEMKQELEKYMQEDGFYDIEAIAKDNYDGDDEHWKFYMFFGDDDEDGFDIDEMLKAAKDHNVALEESQNTSEKLIADIFTDWTPDDDTDSADEQRRIRQRVTGIVISAADEAEFLKHCIRVLEENKHGTVPFMQAFAVFDGRGLIDSYDGYQAGWHIARAYTRIKVLEDGLPPSEMEPEEELARRGL